jgi:virginiamycin B lyase
LAAGFILAQSPPAITEYAIPTASSSPLFIAAGPDGALWFTEFLGSKIGRITTTGAITEYPTPTPNSGPYGITAGPDGALWFPEYFANKIGRISTAGFFTEYTIPTASSSPVGVSAIAVGPDGALWFTEQNANKIGRITTAGGITEYPTPVPCDPLGIVAGLDGALWFTEHLRTTIGRITTSGTFSEYPSPTQVFGPTSITAGPDGALWFTEWSANAFSSISQIGRITTSGNLSTFKLSAAGSQPEGITAGPDDALWFTEAGNNAIGRITTTGVLSEYPTPVVGSTPVGIAAGPDGALWFTEGKGNNIGRIAISGVAGPTIHAASLLGGEVGIPYSAGLIASGGTPPYSNWTVVGGSLPLGLTLNASTGVVSGTPMVVGTSSFGVTTQDSTGATSPTQSFSILVSQKCAYAINPGGQTFTSGGGSGSITVTADAGCLWTVSGAPAWMTIVSAASGSGNGFVNYTVAANTGAGRSANLTIASFSFIIVQQAASILVVPATTLQAPVGYSTANAINQHVAVADFDGDGHLDIVTNNYTILMGNGDGTFRTPVIYTSASNSYSVVTGDFNHDGKPDFATARYDGNVGVWLNKGDGTFQPPVLYATGAGPRNIAVGDFNNDGVSDIAVASRQGQAVGVGVLLGVGDGTFRPVVTYLAGRRQTALAVADFNGDGNADIVSVDSDDINQVVTVLLGAGDGTFHSTAFDSAVSPQFVAIGDFNNDGRPDFVLANFGTNHLSVFLGNGDGTFNQPPALPLTPNTGGASYNGLAVGDFDGDGNADIAYTGSNGPNFSIYLGIGDGTFRGAVNFAAGSSPAGSVVAAEFNGDGRTDLAVTNSSNLQILLAGTGSFPSVTTGSLPNAMGGVPYSSTLTAVGGTTPYKWSLSAGNPPAGLSLGSNGTIAGTPATNISAGTYAFTVMVSGQDGTGFFSSQNLSIAVGAVFQINFTPNFIGMVGSPYSAALHVTGGTPPYQNWMVTAGSLPPGLRLDPASGAFSGTPTAAGTFPFTVTVNDNAGLTSLPTKLAITVVAALAISTQSLPNAVTGIPYHVVLTGTGGFPPYKNWTISGALPPGLTLDPAAGVITGTPTSAAGSPFSFSITFSDGISVSMPQAFTITVSNPAGLLFVPVTPCRVADTRNPGGMFGGPALSGNQTRDFPIPASACNIPPNAQAYSLNVAAVPSGPLGFLTLWPAGQPQPLVATLNSDGRIKSNAAIVPAGANGAISVFVTDATDAVLDINGYFVATTNTSALAFYPLTPCRIADTRNATAPVGGPSLEAQSTRSFPILASSCGLPSNAQAYSLNFAAVPKGPTLGFMTAWPAGQQQPLVASLNDPTGTVLSNAVVVPAGTGGAVNVFTTDATDLVIDINGYFASPGAGGLSLYTVAPCRVLDTRLPAGSPPFSTTKDVSVTGSSCGVSPAAQAFVFNATVVPPGFLGYITMWPQSQTRPLAATLNAYDGAITNNMAIIPTTNGSISVVPSAPTHLILDIFGYFAP